MTRLIHESRVTLSLGQTLVFWCPFGKTNKLRLISSAKVALPSCNPDLSKNYRFDEIKCNKRISVLSRKISNIGLIH